MLNSRRVSDLLKKLGEDWDKVVWNEAYEANISMDTSLTGEASGRSFAVEKPEEKHARMQIRTVGMKNNEEWTLVQNHLYQSTESSAITLSKDSRMCELSCRAVNKYTADEESRDWSVAVKHTQRKHHKNDFKTMRRHEISTNSSLELRFNSLQKDYMYFLRSLNTRPAEVHHPNTPLMLARSFVSDSESKEASQERNHDSGKAVEGKTLKPGVREPPQVPLKPNEGARQCPSAGEDMEVDENQSLKKLLGDFMMRNQLQATTIYNMNHRLDELETKLQSRSRTGMKKSPGKDHHGSRLAANALKLLPRRSR
ncbi:unnamed protein product [Calypogeia fissa]